MAAKRKAAPADAREPSPLDVEGREAEEETRKKPGGQPGPRGPYKTKKKVGVRASDDVIAALGMGPFLAAGAVASAFGQRAVFDQDAVDQACKAFKEWASTWEEFELTPGMAYASSVAMAFMSIKLEPLPQRPKEARNAEPGPAKPKGAEDPVAPGSRAQPAA